MSTDIAVVEKEEDVFIQENVISLKGFPPVLKRLGKHILESDKPLSIAQASDDLGLSLQAVYQYIWRSRKKGKDFNKFIQSVSQDYLHANKIGVVRALLDGAVSDSHADRKLYFQLTGDLKENTVNTGSITLNIGINTAPVSSSETVQDKGVIDVEPVIPEDSK